MQREDVVALFEDVASYNQMILGPKHAGELVDIACRSALSTRSVAHLTTPSDIQDQVWSDEPSTAMFVPGHTSSAWQPQG